MTPAPVSPIGAGVVLLSASLSCVSYHVFRIMCFGNQGVAAIGPSP